MADDVALLLSEEAAAPEEWRDELLAALAADGPNLTWATDEECHPDDPSWYDDDGWPEPSAVRWPQSLDADILSVLLPPPRVRARTRAPRPARRMRSLAKRGPPGSDPDLEPPEPRRAA